MHYRHAYANHTQDIRFSDDLLALLILYTNAVNTLKGYSYVLMDWVDSSSQRIWDVHDVCLMHTYLSLALIKAFENCAYR